jgi:glucose/arabinose dehydrogenase
MIPKHFTKVHRFALVLILGLLLPTPGPASDLEKRLGSIRLPPGFEIGVFSDRVPNARSLALSPTGTLFVGTRKAGRVYALRDTDGDGRADRHWVIARGLNMPNGVAFRSGDLYVAEVDRILRFRGIESRLEAPPPSEVIFDGYPKERSHGWKFIRFGPDGHLYVPVGAPCNICAISDPFAAITRLDVGSGQMRIIARGVRNTVGFDWHPETGDLWFTDNGRDWLGDDLPPDELNHATGTGLHFGYPFCHGGFLADPEFGDRRDCDEFTPPAMALGPHVAALGMRFYTGDQFPPAYRGQIFIAEHGSWNRSKRSGSRITLVTLEGNRAVSYMPFATGWLQGQRRWGRPVDIEILADGAMLVSDDHRGAIYRIFYKR